MAACLKNLMTWGHFFEPIQLIAGVGHVVFDMSSLRCSCMKVFLAVSLGRWRFSVCSFWKSWEVLASRRWMGLWRSWTGCGRRWFVCYKVMCSHCSRFCCANVPCSFSLQNQDLVDQYLSVILGLEPNQSYAAMLGLLVQFCTAQKEMDIIKQYKVNLFYCLFFVCVWCHWSWRRGWTDVSKRLVLCIYSWFRYLSIQS